LSFSCSTYELSYPAENIDEKLVYAKSNNNNPKTGVYKKLQCNIYCCVLFIGSNLHPKFRKELLHSCSWIATRESEFLRLSL
jgi:hypothetical protein